MLPSIVLITLPIPFVLLLILLTLYHLTPLLTLLPNLHLVPLLHRLSTVIPHPRKRNLPREFFNLPPRPGTPAIDDVYLIGIRGKVILLLLINAALSLGFGWGFLLSQNTGLGGVEGESTVDDSVGRLEWCILAMSATPLPSTLFALSSFAASAHGITHETIFRKITPISLVPTFVVVILVASLPSHTTVILLNSSSLLVFSNVALACGGLIRKLKRQYRGHIRLASPESTCATEKGLKELRIMKDSDSWLTSPSQASANDLTPFTYSPGITPKSNRTHERPRTHRTDGSPTSWVSSPSNTPSTIPSWEWSPDSVRSPETAVTRKESTRSPSPRLRGDPPTAEEGRPRISPGRSQCKTLPKVTYRSDPKGSKASQATAAGDRTGQTNTTLSGTPGSAIRSPGGSILGAYSPDPSHPIPRGFESLTSFPMSPSWFAKSPGAHTLSGFGDSRLSLNHPGQSADTIAFIPEERRDISGNGSTWTLESYHSAMEFVTPAKAMSSSAQRRAPPPPPIPSGVPLPPTPMGSGSRSPTVVDWEGKESAEYLLGEKEWVEVDNDVDGVDGWGREGRGVGIMALITILGLYSLQSPMFTLGLENTTQILFLVSIFVPAPVLLAASYLLRYRPVPTPRLKKMSTKSASTHRSLALVSESQLSLPISISPKLTPPNDQRASEPTAKFTHFLEPRPTVSRFGHNRPRPHTVFGAAPGGDSEQDVTARKVLARRSTEVWLENGHAVEGGNRWSRTAEMLKPVPAMRILDSWAQPPKHKALTRLRGGVMSMLPNRASQYDPADIELEIQSWKRNERKQEDQVPSSPITISVTSPSKFERRSSAGSEFTAEGTFEGGEAGDGFSVEGPSLPTVEFHTATRGMMSPGPSVVLTNQGRHMEQDGYELDWLTAGVLPNLVPGIKIGSDIKIGPRPREASDVSAVKHKRSDSSLSTGIFGSVDFPTPSGHSQAHSHGRSTSVDMTSPDFVGMAQSTPHHQVRRRVAGGSQTLRHKKSFSLPHINPVDFEDVRRSFADIQRPDFSARPTSSGDQVASVEGGVDLPPFPVDYTRGRDLSRVTERDESNESVMMAHTLNDMGKVILALSSSPWRPDDRSFVSASSSLRRARGLGDLAPLMVDNSKIGNFSFATTHPGDATFSRAGDMTLLSEEEEMAEEMERVMAMDTPTRAEFVISPAFSAYTHSSRPTSRSSHRTAISDGDVPPVPKVDSRFATPQTNDQARFADADEEPLPAMPPLTSILEASPPPISELAESPQPFAMGGMTFSHPHPPPSHATGSVAGFVVPHGLPAVPTAHPPIQLARPLTTKRSNETMRSEATTTTTEESPLRETEPFKPSRQELMLVKQLKERREAVEAAQTSLPAVEAAIDLTPPEQGRSRSALGARKDSDPAQKGIMSDKNLNRMSAPLPTNMGMVKPRRISVLEEEGRTSKMSRASDGMPENVRGGKLSSETTGSRKTLKVQGKGSKRSAGSGVTPLRA